MAPSSSDGAAVVDGDEEKLKGADSSQKKYTVQCHCGRIRGRFCCRDISRLQVWNCNCSDCAMRGNVHAIAPQTDFTIDMQREESYEDATTLYLWGTNVAQRRFCKTCGILPWYTPRSNPDCFGVTIRCVDWMTTSPNLKIDNFDGKNWEAFKAAQDTEGGKQSREKMVHCSSKETEQHSESLFKDEFIVRCHCGRIRARFECSSDKVLAGECNCSDCYMRGNIETIIPPQDFHLDSMDSSKKPRLCTDGGRKSLSGRFAGRAVFCRGTGPDRSPIRTALPSPASIGQRTIRALLRGSKSSSSTACTTTNR